MEPTIIKDISVLLNAVGVGNCFLLSYTYLLKKDPKALPVSPILSLLFFVLGIVILNTILNFSNYGHQLYGFEPLSNAVSYAIAPLLFLYIKSLSLSKKILPLTSSHLVFFYVMTALTIIGLVFPSSSMGAWSQSLVEHPWSKVAWNLHFLGYLVALFYEIRKTDKQLTWTSVIIVGGTSSIWFLNLFFYLYRTWIEPLPDLVHLNITLLFSMMTLYLFYKKIGIGVEPLSKIARRKTIGSAVVSTNTDPIIQAICEHKYYTNPDLDIRTLSRQLQLPYHELSSYINQHFGQNFNTFINALRIQEVVSALETQQHQSYTIMGLAQKAGFKSASAFYAAFKKEKGTTPSAYLKQSA